MGCVVNQMFTVCMRISYTNIIGLEIDVKLAFQFSIV